MARLKPKAIILSGGPASRARQGRAAAAHVGLRGRRAGARHLLRRAGDGPPARRQGRGRAPPRVRPRLRRGEAQSALIDGVWQPGERHQVWMSHGDRVTALPAGFEVVGSSEGAPFAMIADEERRFYAIQFHLEVVHTPDGARLLVEFRPPHRRPEAATGPWPPSATRRSSASASRSARAASSAACPAASIPPSPRVLLHEAIGDQLTCILVDHGLMRQNEAGEVVGALPRPLQHPARPRRCQRPLPRRARRRQRPGAEAQDHRPPVHRRLRGGGEEGRRRRFPGPGHALSRT